MTTRTVMHLVHKNGDDKWHLESQGKNLGSFDTKQQAVVQAKRLGQELGAKSLDAQLAVHREDGSIETEWTYGHDPRDIPG